MFETTDKDGKVQKLAGPFIPCGSLEVAKIALKAQREGKTPEETMDAVREAAETDPSIGDSTSLNDPVDPVQEESQEKPAPSEEEMAGYFKHRYLFAYVRLVSGQIHDLTTEELEDIAMLAKIPAVGFQEWLKRKGYLAGD